MLVKLKWSPELSVNHKNIDDQHRSLFGIINTLVAARKNEDKQEVVIKVLRELIDYSRTHFFEENKHMYAMKYPRIEQHMNEHSKFVAKIAAFLDDYEAGTATLSEEILKYLTGWWMDHVSESDMGYANYAGKKMRG